MRLSPTTRSAATSAAVGLAAVAAVFAVALSPATTLAAPTKRSAKDYLVASRLPGIPFDLGPSYAGYMPISAKPQEKNELFFWYFPLAPGASSGADDITIWLNGGPGCSSLEGLFQENGPFIFDFNTTGDAVKNPYSWTKLSNVLWVEQPLTTGFSRGTVSIHDQTELAQQFSGFLAQLVATFPDWKTKRLWITGESYAGKYIPYIAYNLLKQGAKAPLQLNGIAINDPSFTNDRFAEDLPALAFARANQRLLHLSDAFLANLTSRAKAAGIADYLEKNLAYPPKGPLTLPAAWNVSAFSPWNDVYDEAVRQNACFNVYRVNEAYSSCATGNITDPLGFPPAESQPSARNVLNDLPGLKQAIHADPKTQWLECTVGDVFVKGVDASPPPDANGVLQYVIERSPSKRTVVQHGEQDYILLANGSALALQNLTWNGQQGFRQPTATRLVDPSDGSVAGSVRTERGLSFVRVSGAGHMIPQDRRPVGFKLQQYLLGQISEQQLHSRS